MSSLHKSWETQLFIRREQKRLLLEHFRLCSGTVNVGSCNNPVEKLTVLSGGLCECSNCCSCLIVSLCEQAHLWTGSHTGSFLVPVGFFSQNCLKKNNSIVESYMIMMSDPRSLLTRERWSRSPRKLHGSEMVLRFGQDEWQEASHQQHFSPQCHCFSPCHLHSSSVWGRCVSYSFWRGHSL